MIKLYTSCIITALFFFKTVCAQQKRIGDKYQNNVLVIKVKKSNALQKHFTLLSEKDIHQKLSGFEIEKVSKILKQKNHGFQFFSGGKKSVNTNRVDGIYKLKLHRNADLEVTIQDLKREGWIEYVEPIYNHELMFIPNDTYQAFHWGHTNTKTYEAWDISQGDTSIVIGIIDTGVKKEHPGLASQLHYNNTERFGIPGFDDDANGFVDDSLGYNFGDLNNDITDYNGHGTEVSGVAAASVNDGFGTMGTGYNSRFMPIKIFSANEQIVNVFEAMLYAAENGCKILNLSLGRFGLPSQYEQDIINFITEEYNVLIVAAAGNTNAHLDSYPASYNNVLSVAHSTISDERFSGATYSYFVDLMAPGNDLTTTYLGSEADGHRFVTGSSYASPFTAGIASLLWAKFPELKAPQVGQILRMSADDVYGLTGNQGFEDKLGKGRLNALRAINEVETLKSVRARNISYTEQQDLYFSAGDTINISVDFVNYLHALSNEAHVRLTTTSEYAQVIDSTFQLGILATNGTVNNQQNPFKIIIAESIPINTRIYFKLIFSDADYEDYQYFYIDPILNIRKGDWELSLEGNGRLGYIGEDAPYNGIGLNWKNRQLIKDAGLIFSADPLKVSDVVFEEGGRKSTDFTKTNGPQIVVHDSVTIVKEYFQDTTAYKEIFISKELSVFDKQDFISLKYEFENKGSENMKDVFAGLYTDFWMDFNLLNQAAWDSLYKFGYAFQNDLFFGIKVLEDTSFYSSLDINATQGITIANGFSDAEKYLSITGQNAVILSGEGENAHINSVYFDSIPAGEASSFRLVLVAGNNLNELRSKLLVTASTLNYKGFVSEEPVQRDSVFCEGDTIKVTPLNGSIFNFYLASNLNNPYFTGKELILLPSDTMTSVLVSNHENIIESEKVTFNIFRSILKAEILTDSDTISLNYGGEMQFSFLSSHAIKHQFWQLDNVTSSTLPAPLYTYSEPGNYQIHLQVTDSLGCSVMLQKTITVEEFKPIVKDTTICKGEAFIWKKIFSEGVNFYNSFPLISPIYTGDTLFVSDITDDTVFYQRGVNARDSSYVQINLKTSQPQGVIYVPDSVLVGETFTLIADYDQTSSILWETGDGNTFTDLDTIQHSFTETGKETISLIVKDSLGCKYTEIREINVWEREITSLSKEQKV
ncbi:MAG: S8 family serine peptidase, partial [Bacteroidota bacterium]